MALTSRDSNYYSVGEQIASGDTIRFANGDGRFYRLRVRQVGDTGVTVTVRDDNTEDSGGTTIATIALQNKHEIGEVVYKKGYYFDTGLCVDATSAACEILALEMRNEGASGAIA